MIPHYINNIAIKLENFGFETYLVGGSLRNLLMGLTPKDFDLTTNALPKEIAQIFPESIMTNARFGTVIVMVENVSGELEGVEITTFRLEKEYVLGRWPTHIEFTRKLEEDLKRRDFTINAIALKIGKNFNPDHYHSPDDLIKSNLIIDLFNGIEDIKSRVIRAVGNPIERFNEDGLRPLRACRIASVYSYEIEKQTFDAIPLCLDICAQVSPDRVRDEFMKIILESPKPSRGIELMRETGLLKLYIPELLEGYGMEQNKYHVHDVYQHLLDTIDLAPKEIRLAALFHDIGKPRCKEGEHFYGHDKVGAEMTKEIMQRLNFPKKEIEEVANLVRWHMFYLPKESNNQYTDENNILKAKEIRNQAFKYGWTDRAIRRFIHRVGGHDQVDKLLKLRVADALANPKTSFDPTDIFKLAERIAQIREQETLLTVKDLKINGNDLINLGYPQGPIIKEALNFLLNQVIDNIKLNNKDKLIKLALEYLKSKKSKLQEQI